MTLEEGWLKRQGLWKEEYNTFNKEEIKEVANTIQQERDNERYIVKTAKFYLTH